MLIQIHLVFAQNKDQWASCSARQHFLLSFHTAVGKHGGDVCFTPGPKSILTSGRTLFTFPAFEEKRDKTFLGIQKLQCLLADTR